MKKSDLKTGMICVAANGNRYLVIRDGIGRLVRPQGHMTLDSYSPDLTTSVMSFNINQVFEPRSKGLCHLNILDSHKYSQKDFEYELHLIWERKPQEDPEVTYIKAQIADAQETLNLAQERLNQLRNK